MSEFPSYSYGFVLAGAGPETLRSRRRRCGSTVYLGSRADWKPALKTDQRRQSSPASAGPRSAETVSLAPRRRGRTPSASSAAASPLALELVARIQLPTLIGEVTLKRRSMLRK